MSYLEKFSDEELLEIFGSDVEAEIKARGYKYGWYKPTEYAGEIYILVNPAFPNLVKIGYANDVEKRVKSFNRNSGLPDPYHVYATYKVKKRLEDLKLHNLIDSLDSDLRHAKNREFYEMSPEKAYEILFVIAQINGDDDLLVLNPFGDDFFKEEIKDTPKGTKSGTEKPLTVYFEKSSESVPFTTWKGLTESICDKCIKEYGYQEFERFVLDENNKKFHTKKKNQFGKTTEKMIAHTEIRSGLFLNTNNSAQTVLSICKTLVERFPNASFELIYGNPE